MICLLQTGYLVDGWCGKRKERSHRNLSEGVLLGEFDLVDYGAEQQLAKSEHFYDTL